ncbi:MAG: iviTM7 [Candidatus Saccharibacteria bacterium]|jgi:hypothetical protein|nr:iviTM7 [Candidatus Saccharibacteria bacterium]
MPRRNQTQSYQPFRFVSNCQQKRRFSTERQAQESAEYQMLVQSNITLSVYKCELCGGWHLTRQAGEQTAKRR